MKINCIYLHGNVIKKNQQCIRDKYYYGDRNSKNFTALMFFRLEIIVLRYCFHLI